MSLRCLLVCFRRGLLTRLCFCLRTVRVWVAFLLRVCVALLLELTELAKPVEMPCCNAHAQRQASWFLCSRGRCQQRYHWRLQAREKLLTDFPQINGGASQVPGNVTESTLVGLSARRTYDRIIFNAKQHVWQDCPSQKALCSFLASVRCVPAVACVAQHRLLFATGQHWQVPLGMEWPWNTPCP